MPRRGGVAHDPKGLPSFGARLLPRRVLTLACGELKTEPCFFIYTNLEDKNATPVIDIATHKVKLTWKPGCGVDGPRGIAVDGARGFVFVACTDHVQVLDGGHEGVVTTGVTAEGARNAVADAKGGAYTAGGRGARLLAYRAPSSSR